MSIETFMAAQVANLRAKAVDLRTYGAGPSADATERIADDLEDSFRGWWLAQLSVNEAAAESGYSPERLREMVRDHALPHQKGDGVKGHITIARCDLPRRPKPKPGAGISSLADRLLQRPPVAGQF